MIDPPAPARPIEASPLIDFLAYGADRLLIGRLRMDADRLTDLLNEHDEYEIRDVVTERLSDGLTTDARSLTVARGDLLVVQVAGPRGDPDRRRRTTAYPLAVQVGPFRVRGQLHERPGQDPAAVILRRGPMVPLTDAWLDRPLAGERDIQRLGTVVLNRDHIDSVIATWDDSSAWLGPEPVDGPAESTWSASHGQAIEIFDRDR
jgi:hypothetical protein